MGCQNGCFPGRATQAPPNQPLPRPQGISASGRIISRRLSIRSAAKMRSNMDALDVRIQLLWRKYEKGVGGNEVGQILSAYADMTSMLREYGRLRDPTMEPRLRRVVENHQKNATRIAEIRKVTQTEIEKFQAQNLELQQKLAQFKDGDTSLYDTLATDVVVFDVEVSVYSSKWLPVLEGEQRRQVETLRHAAKALRRETEQLKLPVRISSINVGSLAKGKASLLDTARKRKALRSPRGPVDSSSPPQEIPLSPVATSDHIEPASFSEQTWDDKNGVMPRTNTLRMMAAIARSSNAAETRERDQSSGKTMKREPLSFSSTLYQTTNQRKGSVADIGNMLLVRPVRGDGRCLFRSIAKGRAFSNGRARHWSESAERAAADKLRQATVEELRRHRDLLITFCVIEGDFAAYCRKMSNVHTWGGEPEILMLASLLRRPISVYIRLAAGNFRQIQVYGRQFVEDPLFILYSEGTHYDCLIPINLAVPQ